MVESTNKHHDFAVRLNAVMGERGLSVKDLSQACGVTYEMARRYTLGTAKPRDQKLLRIAEWLAVAPSWLDYGAADLQPEAEVQAPPPVIVGTENEDEFKQLTENEKRLIRTFRQYPSAESENMLLVFEMRLNELKEKYKEYFTSIGGKL
jgi:transcriptional regulator with XRE-family HTH domain